MIILGTNSIKATGFDVANSVRFDTNAYMHKTPSGAGSLTTWTFSTWIKRAKLGSSQYIFTSRNDGNNQTFAYFNSDDTIIFFDIDSNADQGKLITNRKFRDVGAWYNLTFIWNTTSGTAGDRIQLWVNGVRETSFSTQTNPDQNDASTMGDAHIIEVGRGGEDSNYANYYMAETVYQNNSATTPVDKFGEYDSDSGIWKPINVSGLTAGTNGFYLDFEDSSNLGNDAFGGTDLTEVNLAAIDQSTDTCTNNFATWNNLLGIQIPDSFSEGNLKVARTSGSWTATFSTIAASSGKFYAEVKWVQGGEFTTGFGNAQSYASDQDLNDLVSDPGGGGYLSVIYKNGVLYENGSNTGTGYSTYGSGDIIMLAMDLDNYKLYLGVNGTWGNSANPATNSNGVAIPSAYQGDFFHFAVNVHSSGTTTASGNFGSPEFSISSGNADGNGYGNFEYAVPSGYFSLNTKNLAEFG